jgi:hypothetical protein
MPTKTFVLHFDKNEPIKISADTYVRFDDMIDFLVDGKSVDQVRVADMLTIVEEKDEPAQEA